MTQPPRAGITVPEMFASLGMRPTARQSWMAGAAARQRWKEIHGDLPDKALRTKTSGKGSHCFAVYQDSWRDTLAKIVRRVSPRADERQPDLFGS